MTPTQALIAFGLLAVAALVGLILDIRHANKARNEKRFNDRVERFVARLNRVRVSA